MNFLKKLFGGGQKPANSDPNGLYFYVRAHKCEAYVRVRADKQHDLERTDDGFVWHKTIVDSKCFSRMQAVVHFDHNYQVTASELDGGTFITKDEYEAAVAPKPAVEPVEENDEP